MIVTKQFGLTNKEYFKMLLAVYLKKKKFILVILWALTFIALFLGNWVGALIGVLYNLYVVIWLWRFSYSKDNKMFLRQRYLQIEGEDIIVYVEGEMRGKVKVSDFIRVIKLKNYYLLYLSKLQMMYFPKDAFSSQEDEIWFRNNILERIGK